ncbi:hypothetical protein D8Y22_06445 [Salinadaptatus halalkaliphilus]|uniref:DUF8164 domain-containing protein n=1 Tax=Salinadaptatus halalkaliphilus TaxID=2419781 RepID=A0A4S3TNB6_9EURY|nr:hypothetical protein [Salinadaptatus halalkaliphilus]THE65799.1 hypothetical protein D8Y22_06445 [Salinadaptatus halalkaliphilus]
MSGGELAGGAEPVQYSVGPLLERSQLESDGVLEIGIAVDGSGRLDDHDLDVLVPSPRIDPGEAIELGVFVSSVGEIEAVDLTVFYDDTAVLDLEDPGIVRRNVATGTPGGDGRTLEADRGGGETTHERASTADDATELGEPIDSNASPEPDGTTASIAQHVHSTTLRDGTAATDSPLEQRPLGGSHQDDPAYILELNTRASAPTGEYPLSVMCTYRSEDGIKRVRKRPTVRIRSWHERWRPWLLRTALGAVVLGALVLVVLAL